MCHKVRHFWDIKPADILRNLVPLSFRRGLGEPLTNVRQKHAFAFRSLEQSETDPQVLHDTQRPTQKAKPCTRSAPLLCYCFAIATLRFNSTRAIRGLYLGCLPCRERLSQGHHVTPL
ncbi:unnamed protein product, partial [Amoebophrya sp. A25]|eukprot:GSA25T00016490001.1